MKLRLLRGKKYVSVVDTKKGYWHVELGYPSSLLYTFNTPFGRVPIHEITLRSRCFPGCPPTQARGISFLLVYVLKFWRVCVVV